MPSPFIKPAFGFLFLFGAILASGCSAPAGEPIGTSEPVADEAPPRAPEDPNVFNVAIYTIYDVLYIDDLELEFNQRRGFRAMMGFDENDFTNLTSIPWRDLARVDFEGLVEDSVWEQIFSGREDQSISREQVHKILLQFRDGNTRFFYLVITKFRGYKDGVRWELSMVGNEGIDYILFNP